MVDQQKQWQRLAIVGRSGCPTIFYLYDRNETETSSKLLLTDLVAVWACYMDSCDVLELAKKQKTSIDPSESKAQTRVLLQKLGQSLASGTNELSLNSAKQKQVLNLRTTTELPKPLRPLQWTFELEPQPAVVVAEQLLRPCLLEASLTRKKLENLHQMIKTKDHVINKLLDKIESAGTDMSMIFPGITGLKSRQTSVSVAEAKKHVPGLAEFSELDWSLQFDNTGSHDQTGLADVIDGFRKCPQHTAAKHDDWLDSLPHKLTERFLHGKDKQLNVPESSTHREADYTTEEEGGEEEDEFERQNTPPHLKEQSIEDGKGIEKGLSSLPSKRARIEQISDVKIPSTSTKKGTKPRSSSSNSTATETASEEDDSVTVQERGGRRLGKLKESKKNSTRPMKSPSPAGLSKKNHSTRQLGRIGSGPDILQVSSTSPKTSIAGHRVPEPTDSETETDNDDLDHKSSRAITEQAHDKTHNTIGRLGRIGKKKDEPISTAKSANGEPTVSESDVSRMTPELDSADDGREMTKELHTTRQSPTLTRKVALEHKQTDEAETSEQKADRRRQELKQTLNREPVRKKRKL